MIYKVLEQVKKYQMVKPGDKVLLGVSGGADSIFLAEVLFRLREELAVTLGVMHCHHGLRGEAADGDLDFVKKFCGDRNLPFYTVRKDVRKQALENCISVEEAGRNFRYESFARLMEQEDYRVLSVAHHANDRTETMLFHLARGTDLSGLAAMEPVRAFGNGKKLVRPLLFLTREEIEDWLREENIPWRTDESNEELIYSRNLIRHKVVPSLLEVNTRLHDHMRSLAEGAGEAVSFIEEEKNHLLSRSLSSEISKDFIELRIPELKKGHTYLRKAVLYHCLCELSGGKKDVSRIHVEKLMDLMEGNSGRHANLIHRICARREYDNLILFRKKETNEKEKGKQILDQLKLSMEICSYEGAEILKNEYTKYFDCDKINFKPCLRFWEKGDFLYLNEDGGRKLLSRYFIDKKIPAEERKRIPLLADGEHVMWLLGHRISGYYKVTKETKRILKVTVENKR